MVSVNIVFIFFIKILKQVTERTVRAAVEGGDLTKTVITIGEEDQDLDLEESKGPAAPVGRAPSIQRRSSRASDMGAKSALADQLGSKQDQARIEPEESLEAEPPAQTRSRPLQLPAKMGSKIPRRHQQVMPLWINMRVIT